jgi:chromate transporter
MINSEKNNDLKHYKNIYKKLFFTVFKISACTFGGGFVIIPLMRRKFVEELGWIEEQEMMDLTAIAQSSPGAIAVNASILIGYHVAGFTGAMITVLGTVLPPLTIISLISLFYQAFRDNIIVNMAMAGMLAGVAAVICDVVINMIKNIMKQKRILPLLMLAGAFTATYFFKVNIFVIILVCGIIGAVDTLHHNPSRKEHA